ncbi:MAG: hypothetical protein ACLULH_14770 [Bacteroides fragilis]
MDLSINSTKVIPYADFIVPTELQGVNQDPILVNTADLQGDEKQKTCRSLKNFHSLTKQVRNWLLPVRNSNPLTF